MAWSIRCRRKMWTLRLSDPWRLASHWCPACSPIEISRLRMMSEVIRDRRTYLHKATEQWDRIGRFPPPLQYQQARRITSQSNVTVPIQSLPCNAVSPVLGDRWLTFTSSTASNAITQSKWPPFDATYNANTPKTWDSFIQRTESKFAKERQQNRHLKITLPEGLQSLMTSVASFCCRSGRSSANLPSSEAVIICCVNTTMSTKRVRNRSGKHTFQLFGIQHETRHS